MFWDVTNRELARFLEEWSREFLGAVRQLDHTLLRLTEALEKEDPPE